jgi:hypothetical protein
MPMVRSGFVVMVFAAMAASSWAGDAVPVKCGDKTIFTYMRGPAPFKSYVQALYTPSGVNVIRDQVADHIHHHGLMFALTVNDIDFWSEIDKCGKEVSKSFKTREDGVVEQLDWTGPDGKVVLKERRVVRAALPKPDGPTVVTWRMRLEAPDGAPAKLTGSHYAGLGMRFQESMDKIGTFFNSSGQPGELVRGQEYNVPANWCAYTAPCDGKPVTVALFSDPTNASRPTVFFTMPVGFAYQSATLNVYREPLTIEPGKPLLLHYGVALWDGKVGAEQVDAAYKEWLETGKSEPVDASK